MRARMAIHSSATPVGLREVLLRNKPEEMLAISAKGTVPVLQLPDGRVLDESMDIMMWALDQNDPNQWLDTDLKIESLAKDLINENDTEFKENLDRYKYPNRYDDISSEEYRERGEKFLKKLEARLGETEYLLSERASIADVAIFPFVRQFAYVDEGWFFGNSYPVLKAWLPKLIGSSLFQGVMQKYKPWNPGDPVVRFPDYI